MSRDPLGEVPACLEQIAREVAQQRRQKRIERPRATCPNGHPMGEYDADCDHGCIGQ